jgi:hypothetical protein
VSTAPPHPAAAAAQNWHLAGALVALKRDVDAHWPGRDKRSDGGIGDEAHQAKGSATDHNPWLNNTVRAYDFTTAQAGVNGIDGAWFAEQLRLAGLAGDYRLAGNTGDSSDNGYVIYNRKITSPDFSRWVDYNGPDDHTKHVHVSVTRLVAGYEDLSPWAFLQGHPILATPTPVGGGAVHAVPPAPAGQQVPVIGPHPGNTAKEAPAPVADLDGPEPSGYPPAGQDAVGTGPSFRAQFGNEGPRMKELQGQLNRDLPLYSAIQEDGVYGQETAAVIQDFARRVAADPTCPAELRDRLAGAHGDNIGPGLAAAFPLYGIHV